MQKWNLEQWYVSATPHDTTPPVSDNFGQNFCCKFGRHFGIHRSFVFKEVEKMFMKNIVLSFLLQTFKSWSRLCCCCCCCAAVADDKLVEHSSWGFNSFLKNGPTPASFSFIFGLFKQTLQIFTKNICEKNPIKYTVPGYKPTTFETWVSSHNH